MDSASDDDACCSLNYVFHCAASVDSLFPNVAMNDIVEYPTTVDISTDLKK